MKKTKNNKVIFSWSGGKDSAMALFKIKKAKCYEIKALLTTMTKGFDRISMHGVRKKLLEQQAESLDIPIEKIYITKTESNKSYEAKLKAKLMDYKNHGISSVVIGDIFLEDLRKHREKKLSQIDMKGIFPLWKIDTKKLADSFIDSGFKAIVTCVDSKSLDKKYAGRIFDRQFLSDLPSGVDPCGENGEFHSFVFDGPIFREKIKFDIGEIVLRENRFYFCDLVPA
jgi:uncharacterized protein (TIGR00290 family)